MNHHYIFSPDHLFSKFLLLLSSQTLSLFYRLIIRVAFRCYTFCFAVVNVVASWHYTFCFTCSLFIETSSLLLQFSACNRFFLQLIFLLSYNTKTTILRLKLIQNNSQIKRIYIIEWKLYSSGIQTPDLLHVDSYTLPWGYTNFGDSMIFYECL